MAQPCRASRVVAPVNWPGFSPAANPVEVRVAAPRIPNARPTAVKVAVPSAAPTWLAEPARKVCQSSGQQQQAAEGDDVRVEIHVASAAPSPRSVWMDGSATFTIWSGRVGVALSAGASRRLPQ